VCGNSGKDYLDRPGSCGKPFPIVDWIVVDADTAQVSLLVRFRHHSPGAVYVCVCWGANHHHHHYHNNNNNNNTATQQN
jgi:hypothetical protein